MFPTLISSLPWSRRNHECLRQIGAAEQENGNCSVSDQLPVEISLSLARGGELLAYREHRKQLGNRSIRLPGRSWTFPNRRQLIFRRYLLPRVPGPVRPSNRPVGPYYLPQ